MNEMAQGGAASTARVGILLMLLGMFLFTLNDAIGKWLVATYTVGQVLLIRSVFALAVLAPRALKLGDAATMAPSSTRFSSGRSCLGGSSSVTSRGR